MRQIIFLVNPISGTKSKTSLKEQLQQYCAENRINFRIEPTNAAGEYEYLREIIEKEAITDIVICGGDGTINQVVGALYSTPVNFGIIPFGSGNGLAHSAKIPASPLKALAAIFNGVIKPTDAFRVNGRFACMLSGVGFDADVAHAFAKQKTRGLITYTRESIKQLFAAKAYPFGIEINGSIQKTEAFFISVANSNQFGNQFTIAPKASLNDGLLDIVVVKKMNKALLPFTIFSQVMGTNEMHPIEELQEKFNIDYFQTEKIVIHNPGMAQLHIDGDPVETAARIEVDIIKGAFNMWMPT